MDSLTEQEKVDYIDQFYGTFESLLIKKRLQKKARRTKYKIEKTPSRWPYGVKRLITLTNGRAVLKFTIEARPFLWTEGTVYIETEFEDGKRLLLPKRKIRSKAKGKVWKPGFDLIFFLANTGIIANYIETVELTMIDVGLFDSIESFADSLFGK